MTARTRLCHFVIGVSDLDRGAAFWTEALDAVDEPLPAISSLVYRHLRLPDTEIAVLLQKTDDKKVSKERMHLDLEADDVEAEVKRLEALGATRWDHQQERGFDFWVMRDPWGNEFCVLHPESPSSCPSESRGTNRSDDRGTDAPARVLALSASPRARRPPSKAFQ
jgi:predicted enzyme related to lactoylglutathione lyase